MSGFRELTVPYARAGERELRLFVTAPEGTRGPYPTLLDFHGGAWTHFEPRVDLAWCRELARAGVLSASVEFRLAPEHPWPAVLADARAALRWLTAHGDAIGADVTRLATIGGSTGGFLSILLALCPRTEGEPPTPAIDTADDLAPAAPRAAIGFYPIVDVVGRYHMVREARFSALDRWLRERLGPPRRGGRPLASPARRLAQLHALKSRHPVLGSLAGGLVNRASAAASRFGFVKLAVFEELVASHEGAFASEREMEEASPLARVRDGRIQARPPILVIQGTEDINVTAAMTEAFGSAYRAAGGDIALRFEPAFPHAFASVPSPQSDVAIRETLAFLRQHQLLEPDRRTP
jgi:acetyl esterase/lipase